MKTSTQRETDRQTQRERMFLKSRVLQLGLARWRLVGSSGTRDHMTNECVLVAAPLSPVFEFTVDVDSTRVGDALWSKAQVYAVYSFPCPPPPPSFDVLTISCK